MLSDDVILAFGRAARAVHDEPSAEEALQVVAASLTAAVEVVDHVSVCSTRGDGGLGRPATTSSLAHDLDELQRVGRQGPARDVLGGADTVLASHIGSDRRWPAYAPRAAELGLRSQLSLRLHLEQEGTVGALNLYSATSDTIGPDDVALATLFATQATAALGTARKVETLTQAIGARQRIGQALGILMERHRLSASAAQAFLWRRSMDSNVKVRDLAADVVTAAEGRAAGGRATLEAPAVARGPVVAPTARERASAETAPHPRSLVDTRPGSPS